jgi:hypothetical protein
MLGILPHRERQIHEARGAASKTTLAFGFDISAPLDVNRASTDTRERQAWKVGLEPLANCQIP